MSDMSEYVRPKDVDNRASFARRCLWRIEATLWTLFCWWPLSQLRPEEASNVAGWIARRFGPLLSQHKVVLDNLKQAYPDWDDNRVNATAIKAWESAGRTVGELPHLSKMNPYTDERIDVLHPDRLDAIEASSTGAVIVTGHFANWEVMAAAICKRPVDCLITYRAINNPHIDRQLSEARRAYGVEHLAPKGLGARAMMQAIQDGRSVAILNDQKFREGIAVPFFGRDAMTATGPARLALKYNVPIVPISTVRTGPAKHCVTVHEQIIPVQTDDTDKDVRHLVEQITEFIETRIREQPDQWFWMHRRWPKHSQKE